MSSQQSNQNNKSNTKNRNGNSKRHVGGGDVAGEELLDAAWEGNTQRLLQLLTNGVDVEYRDNEGWTALYCAAIKRNVDCLLLLIDHGADIHARANNGTDCVQLLINLGCDIHARTYGGRTLLHAAAQGGNTECVKLLHGLRVDISAKNAQGNTAYDIAKKYGKMETADLLQQLSNSNPITSKHNIHEKQSNLEPDQISMEINEHNTKPSNVTTEQTKVKQNQCHRCQCKSCISKDNKFNDLQQEIIQLKRKIAVDEQQTEKREAEIKRQMSAIETRLVSIDKLEQDVDGLQRENTALKEEMLQIVTKAKEEIEGQSIALRQDNAKVVSTIDKQVGSITAIQEGNTQLKDKVTAIANRMVSIEQREHGHSGLPLVVTTMAGFNFGNIVGKDFMHPEMQQIFSHATFEAFKNHSEPQLIAEYMWTNNVITEKQYQEIKGHTTVIGKAEHIWSLMKLERRYLESVREALWVTNQDALATKLQ